MIVLLRADADAAAVEELVLSIQELGLDVVPLDERKGRGFEVVGPERGRVLALRDAPAVDEILTRRTALSGGEPLWPHFALRVGILVLLLLVTLVLLSAFFPPGLSDSAMMAGERPGQVEWFLRPLAGMLSMFPPRAAVVGGLLFLLYWLCFIFWPFIDRSDARTPGGRRAARLVFWMGVSIFVLLIVLGVRGSI